MRDGQSLLEQLLAFAPERVTLDDVHRMLGTAGEQRLSTLVEHLVQRDAAAALADLDAALREGVEVAQLLEQLFGYLRDCMAAAAGCPAESFLHASPSSEQQVVEAGKRLGMTTTLAAMQALEQTLNRLKFSTQGRILTELALVRICSLEDLDDLPELIAQLRSGVPAGGGATGRPASRPTPASRPGPTSELAAEPTEAKVSSAATSEGASSTRSAGSAMELTPENAPQIWARALETMSGMVVEQAKQFDHVAVAGTDHLAIVFKPEYALAKAFCERSDWSTRFHEALRQVTGKTIRVTFTVDEPHSATSQSGGPGAPQAVSPRQRLFEASKHPMVRRAADLFGAEPVRVDDPPNPE
jgi:DNA polymerase-3 subunit gamma/tau